MVEVDPASLRTESDWIRWGAQIFGGALPGGGSPELLDDLHDPRWYERTGTLTAADGTVPAYRYVVGPNGTLQVRAARCMPCHSRILDDGTVVVGAQGNHPVDRIRGDRLQRQALSGDPAAARQLALALDASTVPWLSPDPADALRGMSPTELARAQLAVPPGVVARFHTSALYPPKTPDLIGVKDRRYLDATGLVQHRSIADLMRYVQLVEGAESGDRFGRYGPFAPTPSRRFSDEQLYATALFVYSLKPPANPNVADERSRRGATVFTREGCDRCHTPPLYTSNALTPALGFAVPSEHRQRFSIIPTSVGTDPRLAMASRKGTGYYRIPSLRGVWYRGPFEHNGSVATLEDWFDPARLSDDYVPTGFRGVGVEKRAVKGHPFGLRLSAEEKAALIAFLRTL